MARIRISSKQKEFLTSKARVVLYLAGIGAGKSFVGSEKACQQLALGAHTIVMAQSYKTLKLVMFAEILQRLRDHGIDCIYYKADMVIEVPSTGGKIMGFSMDSVEAMRGVTVDNAILDEAALYDEYAYKVLCGRLRRGKFPYQVWLTTTPRGKANWVYTISGQEFTHFIHATTKDNPFLPKEYLEQIYEEYDGDFAAQELEAAFVDGDGSAILIPFAHIEAAAKRIPLNQPDLPIVAGLDVARYGDDASVLVFRQGDRILFRRKWQKLSLPQLERKVMEILPRFPKTEYLVIDGTGVGGGTVDHLREAIEGICTVVEFNGANSAKLPSKYNNLRTESWCRLAEWLETGCLDEQEVYESLAKIEYFIDAKGRKAIESKERMRSRKIKSPDDGDAIAMTLVDLNVLSKKNQDKIKAVLMNNFRPS